MYRVFLIIALGMLVSCAKEAVPPYNTDMPMIELMNHAITPAAFAFWAGSGTRITEEGEEDLAPNSDEEWDEVEEGAAIVAQMANVMMLPGYAREPLEEWNHYASEVARIALEGKSAAEMRDPEAIEFIGGDLVEACDGCHAKFPSSDGN